MHGSVRTVCAVMVAAWALAGCTAEAPAPTVTPTPTPVVELPPPVEVPQDPPAVDPRTADDFPARPDLEDLVVWTGGVGPLTVGNDGPEDNPGAQMLRADGEACPADDAYGSQRWLADGYEDVDPAGAATPAFTVEADAAAVHWIDITGVSPRTDGGVGLGTALAEALVAHLGMWGPVEGEVSDAWIWFGDTGALVIESRHGDDARGMNVAGRTVDAMRVLHPEFPADWTALGDELRAGACVLP